MSYFSHCISDRQIYCFYCNLYYNLRIFQNIYKLEYNCTVIFTTISSLYTLYTISLYTDISPAHFYVIKHLYFHKKILYATFRLVEHLQLGEISDAVLDIIKYLQSEGGGTGKRMWYYRNSGYEVTSPFGTSHVSGVKC